MDIKKTINSFKEKGFKVTYVDTKKEAAEYLTKNLREEVIGMGGSCTLEQLDVFNELNQNNTIWWHHRDANAKRKYGEFTVYITSANAISETGEIVNIDGTGNRISATFYGPRKIIYVIGKNKIAPDLDSAIRRAREIAGPQNAKRLKKKTPCTVTGKCTDCKSPERICRGMSITMWPMLAFEETEIILVNEDLGL